MDNIIENLKDVFELATEATTLVKEITKLRNNKKDSDKDNLIKVSRGYSAKIGSSGDYAQIGSSGYYAKIGSSGYSAQIGSSGGSAKIGSSGDYAQIGSSGYYAKIGSSGDSAQIGSSGDYAQIGSSGDYAKIGSSGDSAQIGSSGYYAKIGSSGDYAKIGSSGDSAQIGSSGYSAKINSEGQDAVIASIGYYGIVKAKKGSWITLAEYRESKPYFVKTEQVDGEKIKEDIYYSLYNKEFHEVEFIDNIPTIILKRHRNIIKTKILNNDKESYIFTKDGINAHGKTIKSAYRDWLFKTSDRDVSQYEDLDPNEKHNHNFWIMCYRTITGACSLGTENFLEHYEKGLAKELTLDDVINATEGQYGHNTFVEFFKGGE